jgi:hypothetical protein
MRLAKMSAAQRITLTLTLLMVSRCLLRAQDLAPRAYIITPIHSNAITLTYTYSNGNIIFEGGVPITDSSASVHTPILSLYHSLSFFGRSANITASLPYSVADFHGTVMTTETSVHRSGLLDSSYRFSVNLKGGPAMDTRDFAKWEQKTIIGASLKVVVPTGQYDPTKLINLGGNRWGFKPEIGLSRRWGHWVVDGYGAVWFFTDNHQFFSHNQFNPGTIEQSQSPIGAFEGHLSYDVRQRLWASLDGNFWFGGETSLNGVANSVTLQRNSRIGFTVSVPVTKRQSFKFSYANGAYIRFGGDYQTVAAARQYTWFGRPN